MGQQQLPRDTVPPTFYTSNRLVFVTDVIILVFFSTLTYNFIFLQTQAGQGIMEEPELTLISSTDISIAESDLDFFSQADSRKVTTENLSCKETPDIKSPKVNSWSPVFSLGLPIIRGM